MTRTPPSLRALLPVLVIAEITSSFEISMMYAAMATLLREFGDPAGVGWLITAYLLVGSVSAALCSRLGDLFGRRRLALAMLACSLGGSLISLFSTSLAGLVAGRAVQGLSAALLPLAVGPFIVLMNDRDYVGGHANGRTSNAIVVGVIALACVLALVALPLQLMGSS